MLEKIFHLKENHTDVKTELMAGITTFMTMVYILAVNPSILSASGITEGGRTGLTSMTTGVLFLLAVVFSPLMYVLTVLFILKDVLL